MSNHTTPWPAGAPCWADLTVNDMTAQQAFYTAILGWDFAEPSPEFGGYTNVSKDGYRVAGFMPKMSPEQHCVWTTYLASDDIAATAASITAAGGTLHSEPMQVGTHGQMLIAVDAAGAFFGVWQAGDHTGFQLFEEPGSVCWADQNSRDLAAAKGFYEQAFGLTANNVSAAEGMDYFVLQQGETQVAGLGLLPPEVPEQVPAHWRIYFAVAEIEASLAKLTELGGSIQVPPFDTEYGRCALVSGPEGEPFTLMQPPAGGFPTA